MRITASQVTTVLVIALTLLLTGCISAKSKTVEPMAAASPAPIADTDGDGVPDDDDRCPNTRAGVEVDASGCEIILRLKGALFDFDKSDLRPDATEALESALLQLEKHVDKRIEAAGHTDAIGSDEYNRALGTRRASTVADFLVSRGIEASRMQVQSYGESQPVASNETEEGRAQNRRVELVDLGS